jgi:IS30 family transposase
MRDLEAEMAKALEGQFFWEHTVFAREATTGDAYDIMEIQRKFRTPKKKDPEVLRMEREARLQQVLAEKAANKKPIPEVCRLTEDELRSFSKHLTKVIADVYGISVDLIEQRTSGPGIGPAKHHLPWAMMCYFPMLSSVKIGRVLGKHHSTISNSLKEFRQVKETLTAHIEAVDALVQLPG